MNCSDRDTFTQLYQSTGRYALSKTLYITRNDAISREIVQEIYLRLWSLGLTFESQKSAYRWIYQACHNAAIDYLRSRPERFSSLGPEQDLALPTDLSRLAIDRDLIDKAALRLSKDELTIFLYVHIDGLTQIQIAEILKLSRKTIMRIMQRVTQKLQGFKENIDET